MELNFKTTKDLLSFTKMALYMTDKKAAKKVLKWKKNGELTGDGDLGYTLSLHNNSEDDKVFALQLNIKYDVWMKTNKMSTLFLGKPSQ